MVVCRIQQWHCRASHLWCGYEGQFSTYVAYHKSGKGSQL